MVSLQIELQQYLPLAVLKLVQITQFQTFWKVATVPTACGIETLRVSPPFTMWSLCCNSTYRLRYWNPRNHYWINFSTFDVATVPTACGIETFYAKHLSWITKLQQYLPLAVLKLENYQNSENTLNIVATVPTACGIETRTKILWMWLDIQSVATVPTACGIETWIVLEYQPLHTSIMLQQCLPLAVLKQLSSSWTSTLNQYVATVPTACGIETIMHNNLNMHLW